MKALLIDPKDNVAVVLEHVKRGDSLEIEGHYITAREDISSGHKIAVKDISAEGCITKYGVPIGKAKVDIPVGSFVHTHNVLDITAELCRRYAQDYRAKEVR